MAKWVLRIGIMLAAVLLPVLLGAPAALLLLLLMPIAVECSREWDKRYFCGVGIFLLMGSCYFQFGGNAWAWTFLWSGCGIGMLVWKQENALKRSLVWTGLSAGLLCLILAWLGSRYQAGIFPGLAEELVNWIDARPDACDILLRCYQMGFSRLEEDLQPVINLFGKLLMTRDVRNQLLYSLRYTLEISLASMVPQLIAAWLLLTLVLTTAVPDVIRRKQGKRGVLPAFGEWRMTDWARRQLNFMAVVYLVTIFMDNPVCTMLGSMCAAVFQYAYLIFGLAVMEGMTKQYGTVRFIRRLWMAGCILFAPFILVILGIADRMFDLRRMSRSTEDKGGFEQ